MVVSVNVANNMTTGATETIEAKWKLKWDYLGWKENPNATGISQKDWNQTLVTNINLISTQMHQSSAWRCAEIVRVHPKTFLILKDFEYIQKFDGKIKIGNRYEVIIDETLPMDKVFIGISDTTKDLVVAIKPSIDLDKNPNCHGMREISFYLPNDEKLETLKEDPMVKIVTPDVFLGEIDILNHNSIDQVTGEILVDYNNEISSEYWTPQPKIIGELVDLFPNTTWQERELEIIKRLKEARLFINSISDPVKKTFYIETKPKPLTLLQRIKKLIKR